MSVPGVEGNRGLPRPVSAPGAGGEGGFPGPLTLARARPPATGARVVLAALGGPDRASSRLRVHGWVEPFEGEGMRCRVLTYHEPGWRARRGFAGRFPRLAAAAHAPRLWRDLLAAAEGADAVVLQEVVPPASVTRRLRASVRRLVFDFSDPIHWAAGPGHSALDRLLQRSVVGPRLWRLARAADAVTVENERVGEAVRAAGGRRVEVVRGPVDTARYVPLERRGGHGGPLTVGWTGSWATLPFLTPVVPELNALHAERGDLRLVLFGVDRPTGLEELPVEVIAWNAEREPRVVAGFDVALNPVPDTPWTRLRGGAKLMTYMACGVPVVSAPWGIGDQVVLPGETGLLASTPGEWRGSLRRLLEGVAAREAMGRRARAEAVQRYSYDAYLPLLRELLLG